MARHSVLPISLPPIGARQAKSPKREPSAVKQAELTGALRAARAAGLHVSGYDVDLATGKISVWTGMKPGADTEPGPLDKWIASHAG